MEKLDLNDKQKEQIIKIREEGKAFHNKQHEKMMGVLTPEQRAKMEGMKMMMGHGNDPKNCPMKGDMKQTQMPHDMKQMQMPQGGMNGMGCKNCDNK